MSFQINDDVPEGLIAVGRYDGRRVAITPAAADEVAVHVEGHPAVYVGQAEFLAAVAAALAVWVVPKIPHDETVSVGPLIHPGGLIVRDAGASDVEHTCHYAAQLLAAAELSRQEAGR